jgi:hypothetical protein
LLEPAANPRARLRDDRELTETLRLHLKDQVPRIHWTVMDVHALLDLVDSRLSETKGGRP